jgi:serine protease Do
MKLAPFLLAAAGLSAQAPPLAKAPDVLHELSQSFEVLSRRVSPAVVQIYVSGYTTTEEGPATSVGFVTKQRSSGSGFIIDPAGYILTNAHVVESAYRVRVMLSFATPAPGAPAHRQQSILKLRAAPVDARVLGVDKETDLALIKIERTGLPVLQFGNSDRLKQGQIVLALGSPLGLDNSLSMGVVSSTARQLKPDDPMVYIQTDAPINPGNSGGPLVDTEGRVVGVNTFILSQSGGSEGIGFSIPSNIARSVARQLKENGHVHRGEIGVGAQTINALMAAGLGLPQDWGVLVSDVLPGSPAASAGVKIQDIVHSLDGRVMENARQFEVNLYRRAEGEKVTLEVLRGQEKLSIPVTVTARPDSGDRFTAMVSVEKNLISRLGLLCIEIDKQVAEMLPGLRAQYGLVIAGRAPTVQGPELSIAVGDVIHAMNGQPVASLQAFRDMLDQLKRGDAMVLQIERDGRLRYLSLEWE